MAKKKPTTENFRVNVPSFLNEIADSALPRTMGILKIPLNVFRLKLIKLAERASELNDPELNKIMAEMALYAVADPYDKDNYDAKICKELLKTGKLPTK